MKLALIFALFSFATMTLSAPPPEPSIRGCSFDVTTYFNGKNVGSSVWEQGFDVEKRNGWGFPMKKQDVVDGERYVGEVKIGSDDTKLVVTVTALDKELTVKSIISRGTKDKVEIVASGTAMARAFVTGGELTAMVSIESPLITAVRENDPEFKGRPLESKLFPKDVYLYGARVFCFAKYE